MSLLEEIPRPSSLLQKFLDDVAPSHLQQGVAEVLVGGGGALLFLPRGDRPVADFDCSVEAMVVFQIVQILGTEVQFKSEFFPTRADFFGDVANHLVGRDPALN